MADSIDTHGLSSSATASAGSAMTLSQTPVYDVTDSCVWCHRLQCVLSHISVYDITYFCMIGMTLVVALYLWHLTYHIYDDIITVTTFGQNCISKNNLFLVFIDSASSSLLPIITFLTAIIIQYCDHTVTICEWRNWFLRLLHFIVIGV